MSASVLIIDDHPLIRCALRCIVSDERGLEIVAEVSNGAEAVTRAAETKPDLVLFHVPMPRISRADTIRKILKVAPLARIVVLTGVESEDLVRHTVQACVAGLLAEGNSVGAHSSTPDGRIYFCSTLAKRAWERVDYASSPSEMPQQIDEKPRLSAREEQILRAISPGKSNRQIAADLGLSNRTVENVSTPGENSPFRQLKIPHPSLSGG